MHSGPLRPAVGSLVGAFSYAPGMSTTRVPFGEARAQLREMVCRAAYGGERITITRNGSPAAALVSLEDLQVLEGLGESQTASRAQSNAVVDADTVIGGSLAAVWGAFAQYRFRTAWWSDLMVDAYVGGEVIVSWDEGVGRVVDCVDGETLTMAWGGNPGSSGPAVEVRVDLAVSDAADGGVVVRVRQVGPGPSADYWRERLEAWRVYVEAASSSIQP